jgi:hypothetical protein
MVNSFFVWVCGAPMNQQECLVGKFCYLKLHKTLKVVVKCSTLEKSRDCLKLNFIEYLIVFKFPIVIYTTSIFSTFNEENGRKSEENLIIN